MHVTNGIGRQIQFEPEACRIPTDSQLPPRWKWQVAFATEVSCILLVRWEEVFVLSRHGRTICGKRSSQVRLLSPFKFRVLRRNNMVSIAPFASGDAYPVESRTNKD